ncbi:MAG TPA: hypothetical protein VG245_03910 [Candidatus Dormibacteraeota bacterium]|nr:hypothetical protein [Candidatus Dormibacteraeota bacterium]
MKLTTEVLSDADADVVEVDEKSDFAVWQKSCFVPPCELDRRLARRMEL